MSKILIETYRGFDILFDTDYEVFQCIVTEERTKESKSFASVKGFVDEFKKNNQVFKPFWVEQLPGQYDREKLKVIGLRKDGRFIVENEKGQNGQISDYSLSGYMLLKSENEKGLSELDSLNVEIENQRLEGIEKRKAIVATLDIVNLKDYKQTLL